MAVIVAATAAGLATAIIGRPTALSAVMARGSAAVTLAAVGGVIGRAAFGPGRVTWHRVRGAVALYLIVGLVFAHLYGLLNVLVPEAFANVPPGLNVHAVFNRGRLLYFSFETLTTTGYGDIVPLHPVARGLATLEALTGQLFPATLLARLVSLELEGRPPVSCEEIVLPSSLQVSAQAQERLAVFLAMIAGYVDAYGFISYRTYVSFMSGNTTQTGSLIGQGNLAAAVPALLAIVFFLIGVFTGTFLTHSGARQSRWLMLGLVATLLAVSIGVTHLGSLASWVGIAALSLAMGFLNTALSRVGAQSVNLVFVTGTLSTMAQHLALAVRRAPLSEAQGSWDTHRRRAFLLLGVWASFLTGALVAGLATPLFGVWVLLVPVWMLLSLAAFSRAQSFTAHTW